MIPMRLIQIHPVPLSFAFLAFIRGLETLAVLPNFISFPRRKQWTQRFLSRYKHSGFPKSM